MFSWSWNGQVSYTFLGALRMERLLLDSVTLQGASAGMESRACRVWTFPVRKNVPKKVIRGGAGCRCIDEPVNCAGLALESQLDPVQLIFSQSVI